ncbi:MAG: methyltransferase domain-containing protein [Blastocatellia bacterium]|nr:methyltransferase domain-containing protein [Blastocatellia bacterium]
MSQWPEYSINFVRHRYDRIAPFFPVFERLFALPRRIRERAVERLNLSIGSCVLEVGCGTGKNLALLRKAVGAEGHVYGVELSEGMLARARELVDKHGWQNVTLTESDAAEYAPPEPVDAVFFSLSYATMPHHHQVLHHVWNHLRPGGRVVIMDAKLPAKTWGRLLLPFMAWISRITVLGDPYIRPWEELQELSGRIDMEEMSFGSYYICSATKPQG